MGPRKRSKPNPQSKSKHSLESPESKPTTETKADAITSTDTPGEAGDVKHLREDPSVGKPEITVRMNLVAFEFGHT